MANTSYIVQDRIEVSIQINKVPYPLGAFNLLNFLQIGWSTWGKMPTCHFAVTDVTHALDQINLQDGIPITMAIRPLGLDTTYYNFRKFHHKKTWNGEAFVYEVDGYLDNPLYWSGTATGGIRGTSNDVLSQIAGLCGLNFEGTTTNDAQLWIPRNRTYGEFVQMVVQRGYADNQSYMVAGLDATGTLYYKNVNALPEPQTKLVLGQIMQNSLTVIDYAPVATSGALNKMQGYQHTRYDQSAVNVPGQGQTDPILSNPMTQMNVTPDVTGFMVNQAVKDKMVQGYRSFGGIDVGNVHGAYEQAIYQNRRMASLYSVGVEFLISTPNKLTLFDRFTFAVDTEAQKQDIAYGGVYTVAAKSLEINGATYAEKILGVRMGTNNAYVSA